MPGAADLDALNTFLAEPRNAIVGGIRKNGRLHMTPNWFLWDGERFFVSITRHRVKYRVFIEDSRVQLVIDDSMGFRYVVVDGIAEVSEDIDHGLPYFRDLRHKHGRTEQDETQLRDEMVRDGRVLLVITPDRPQNQWPALGF
ncbi:MAG: TIGR03618 family F420-dependent PPOX class oxidoreductase [Actinomycetia bacterium]|nr:TIGR03618 family F420-dependent PPOX class oxidoreductase [Actinomycetes bacterium]